jgi:hypothetical protein
LAEPCPICSRPRLVLPYNAETDEPPCFGESSPDCYAAGYAHLSRCLAEAVGTIKRLDALLGRARDVLTDAHGKLSEALKRLPEVAGG